MKGVTDYENTKSCKYGVNLFKDGDLNFPEIDQNEGTCSSLTDGLAFRQPDRWPGFYSLTDGLASTARQMAWLLQPDSWPGF